MTEDKLIHMERVLNLGLVDIGGIEKDFFITSAIFIMLILTFVSLGIVRLFQQRYKPAVIFIVLGVISIGLFVWIMNSWII
ncbi:MAG: hypothetical protein K0R67_1890 [Paenibacillus sp.]|nr:hypothetical protein [Paenibacillus sp.]